MRKFYTDYPFTFLGDESGKAAPVREIELVSYDQDKYVTVRVQGHETEIKSGYIWCEPVPYYMPHTVPIDVIRQLPPTKYPF